jgi:hypothetical protein
MANEKELYFAHTIDVYWILALWHWIHGGDPSQDSEQAQTTELIVRALVGHLGRGRTESANVVEKLAELGIKTVVKVDGTETEIRTTKELHERYAVGVTSNWPIPCAGFPRGPHLACSSPIFWIPVGVIPIPPRP